MEQEELKEREEALAEVVDPDFLLGRDAEGEAEADIDEDGAANGMAGSDMERAVSGLVDV
jgi:RNA polymerase II-associated factor 1